MSGSILQLMPRRAPVRWMGATLSLLAALAAPAGADATGHAYAVVAPRPVIVSVRVWTPRNRPLPAVGARVVVTVRVRHATRCTFLVRRGGRSTLHALRTVRCLSGRASVAVGPIANTSTAPLRITYAVRVRGAGARWVQRGVTVREAAAARQPPSATSTPPAAAPTALLSISRGSVPSTGGSVVLSFSSANAATCSLSSTPALWTGSNPASVDCNGRYTATAAPSTTARHWTFTFTATSASGQSSSASQTLTELAPPAPTWAENPIWSGYVVPSSSTLFTAVSGRWTVPTLNCSATPNGGAGVWVGIGGYGWPTGGSSGTLLQTGVRTDCVNGVAQYAGWFEEYPSSPNTSKEFAGFPVSPGDVIEASVFQASTGAWETRVDDLTTGLSGVMVTGKGWGVSADGGNGSFLQQGSTAGLSYAGGYTAEWIVEDRGQNGSTVPFVDYGTVTFSDLRTSLPSWSLTPSEGLEIAQNGVVLSTPSTPSNGGFSVSYGG